MFNISRITTRQLYTVVNYTNNKYKTFSPSYCTLRTKTMHDLKQEREIIKYRMREMAVLYHRYKYEDAVTDLLRKFPCNFFRTKACYHSPTINH